MENLANSWQMFTTTLGSAAVISAIAMAFCLFMYRRSHTESANWS